MSSLSLITQIAMIGIAITVAVMYINPTISHIKLTQDSIEQYEGEIEKVASVNNLLDEHVAKVNSISSDQQKALLKYVPDDIDEIFIMKDIKSMLGLAVIEPTNLAYTDSDSDDAAQGTDIVTEAPKPYTTHEFAVSFETTYDQLKNFLSLLETNDYLLEVYGLEVIPSDSNGTVGVDLTLRAYSRTEIVPMDVIIEEAVI